MAYTTGGTIQALDYNLLTWGGNTQAYNGTPANLARIWGVGSGYFGLGQDATAMTTVSAGGTVTATQWSTFLQRLNLCLAHQSGANARLASGSNIGITSGATIQAFANVVTAVSQVDGNANVWAAQGSTTTGSNFYHTFTASDGSVTTSTTVSRTITFSSGDAARYFFNAGGELKFVISNVTNGGGTARGTDFVNILGTWLVGTTVKKFTSTRNGAGGNVTVNNANLGYYRLTTSNQVQNEVFSSSATYEYAEKNLANIAVRTNGVQGSNVDNGNVITFTLRVQAGGFPNSNLNDNVSANITHRIDTVNPLTTYLNSSVWGTPTVA
jgi:hypothetical protein